MPKRLPGRAGDGSERSEPFEHFHRTDSDNIEECHYHNEAADTRTSAVSARSGFVIPRLATLAPSRTLSQAIMRVVWLTGVILEYIDKLEDYMLTRSMLPFQSLLYQPHRDRWTIDLRPPPLLRLPFPKERINI